MTFATRLQNGIIGLNIDLLVKHLRQNNLAFNRNTCSLKQT